MGLLTFFSDRAARRTALRSERFEAERARLREEAHQERLASATPCPACGQPANVDPRYANALCDDCSQQVVCKHGQRVGLYNAGWGGGVLIEHVRDSSRCYVTHMGDGNDPQPAQIDGPAVVTLGGERYEVVDRRFGGIAVLPLKAV